jgi:acetyl-CoA carboxylase carboxyl transferase subunit beta
VNWISNVVRPRIRSFLTTKREVPDNLWIKCPETGQMVFCKDLEANQFVVPGSDYHMRMAAQERLKHTFDAGEYVRVPLPSVVADPLKFRDGRRYTDRLKDARTDTELDDAVLVAEGKLEDRDVVVAVQDFRFMGGSLGMAAGEAVIAGMLRAVEKKTPFILFAASGGARMQEGILSLMQMPRTTIAVQRLRDNKLPYIVVLTDPTTGGVTASYAMLGDIHIAEPGALICFAGPRVIQQTIREQLPEGFQRAEYLFEHGMIDMVVHRHKMRETLARVVRLLANEAPTAKAYDEAEEFPLLTDEAAPGATPNGVDRSVATDDVVTTTSADDRRKRADGDGTKSRAAGGNGTKGPQPAASSTNGDDRAAGSSRPANGKAADDVTRGATDKQAHPVTAKTRGNGDTGKPSANTDSA